MCVGVVRCGLSVFCLVFVFVGRGFFVFFFLCFFFFCLLCRFFLLFDGCLGCFDGFFCLGFCFFLFLGVFLGGSLCLFFFFVLWGVICW